jgi:hypothetical protein
MKLLIMQLSPTSYHFIPLRSKYFPQHPEENFEIELLNTLCLRMFENRVLRKIFGPKRDEVIGGWRELHYEELHNSYGSPNKIRMLKSRRRRR